MVMKQIAKFYKQILERVVNKYHTQKYDGEIGMYLISMSHKLKLRAVESVKDTESE
jgi:hypothetical protein